MTRIRAWAAPAAGRALEAHDRDSGHLRAGKARYRIVPDADWP